MEDREKIVREKLAEREKIEGMQYRGVKHYVYELLMGEKGFQKDEILINPLFSLSLSTCEATAGADFIIALDGIYFMIIHCVSSGIEPWERYAVACARAITDYQIPYAAVTDGDQVKLFDIANNSSRIVPIDGIFDREEALHLLKNWEKVPCPEKNREKERRIIYAFEGIKCQPAQPEES